MNENALIEAGLTKAEARLYLALLRMQSAAAGELIRKTGLQSSTVYHAIDGLIKKGLASFVIKANTRHFKAANPKQIIEFIEEKKKSIESIIPELLRMHTKESEEPEVYAFSGFKGLKTAFDDILRTLKEGQQYCFYGATTGIMPERTRLFFKKFHQERQKQGIRLKIVFDQSAVNSIGQDREEEKLIQVKYMPEQFANPAGFAVYNDRLLIVLLSEQPTAFRIQSRETAKSFKKYFDVLWKASKTRKQLKD